MIVIPPQPSTTPTLPPTTGEASDGLSTGATIGIIIGVVVAVLVVTIFIIGIYAWLVFTANNLCVLAMSQIKFLKKLRIWQTSMIYIPTSYIHTYNYYLVAETIDSPNFPS